jgi:hypothetical protein
VGQLKQHNEKLKRELLLKEKQIEELKKEVNDKNAQIKDYRARVQVSQRAICSLPAKGRRQMLSWVWDCGFVYVLTSVLVVRVYC